MARIRPYVMSIAGFDPSGGAGTLADIKTFEQLKTYGFAVITANTFQSDNEVKRVDWLPISSITEQMAVILDKFPARYFKIGIVKDAEMLEAIKSFVLARQPKAYITWDPVLVASSGFQLFSGNTDVKKLLAGISLITPNADEFKVLFESEKTALELSAQCMIYLKGGHNKQNPGKDVLFFKEKMQSFRPKGERISAKHGSGCILSSALTAHLALGFGTQKAILKSKRYVETALASNQGLLAYHKL